MNITPAPYCKRCQFYHGHNSIVCGLYPYGPDSATCSDYAPKGSGLFQEQISKDGWNLSQLHDYKGWQKLLLLSLLVGSLGFGCVFMWFATHSISTQPMPKTTTETEASPR